VQRSLAGRMDGDTDVVPPPFLTGGDVGCAPPTLRRCCRVEGDGALLLVAAVARSVRAPGAWCWGCATVMTAAPHTSAVTAQTRPTAPTCSGKTREATPTTTAAVPADHAGSSHPAAATRQQPPGGLLSRDRRLAQAHLPRVGGAAGVARDDLPDPLRAGCGARTDRESPSCAWSRSATGSSRSRWCWYASSSAPPGPVRAAVAGPVRMAGTAPDRLELRALR
jgi:hypothetical protein